MKIPTLLTLLTGLALSAPALSDEIGCVTTTWKLVRL